MKNPVEPYALVIHGVLLTLHSLAVFHNAKKKNWGDTAFHTIAVAYEVYATNAHAKNIRRENEEEN